MGIFEKAKKGVVLLSFGDFVDKNSLKPKMKQAIIDAFSSFPDYEFIWKLDGELTDDFIDAHSNIHATNWVNQVGILGEF
jgi:hypothetical protein